MYVLSKFVRFIHVTFCLFLIISLAIPCVANDIRRVLYRIGYSSINNTILSVQVFVLLQSSSNTSRITIQWNDIATTTTSGVPRMNYF